MNSMHCLIIPAIPLALFINPVYYPCAVPRAKTACDAIIQTIDRLSNRKKARFPDNTIFLRKEAHP